MILEAGDLDFGGQEGAKIDLGASWTPLGASWKRLGGVLGPLGSVLGRLGGVLEANKAKTSSGIRRRGHGGMRISGPLIGIN